MKPKFRRWVEKQFDKNPEKIKKCPKCEKKIFRKYYSIWHGKYTCKCGWSINGIILKIKRKET